MEKKNNTVRWVATIAVQEGWFPVPTIKQFEFEYPLRKVPTQTVVKQELRSLKEFSKYKNPMVVGIIKV